MGAARLITKSASRFLFPILLAAVVAASQLRAQSLTGTTGLLVIPTAGMPADGAVTVGVNVIDRGYHGYLDPGFSEHAALVQYASVGFLPFAEVGLRLTRVVGVPRQALGDRMILVRVRVLEEGRRRPAIVLGGNDFVGTHRFHTLYAVASKTMDGGARLGIVGLHAGVGGDPFRAGYQSQGMAGALAGVSASPARWATLMAEYDSRYLNAGVRLRWRGVTLIGAAQNLEALSGGASYTFRLPD